MAALDPCGDQLNAFRPDRHRHRGGGLDPLRDEAADAAAAEHLDLAAAIGRADETAGEQVGRPDEAGDERDWPGGNRCPAASRSGVMRPWSITAIRSESASASDWSWVT